MLNSLLPVALFQGGLPETNRSKRVVRLNCKGMLDSCDRVAQLVVGEGVATAGNDEEGRPPPISGCGLSVDIQAVHVQDHSEGGDRPELFSLLELILAALRKKLDSFRWTGCGVENPVTADQDNRRKRGYETGEIQVVKARWLW